MIPLPFVKMHGAGNDYVFVDLLAGDSAFRALTESNAAAKLARRISHRRTGVGSDGLILILPGSHDADAEMRMFNADGAASGMCGNGLRCVAALLHVRHRIGPLTKIRTGDRVVEAIVLNGDALDLSDYSHPINVSVDVGSPVFAPAEIPVAVGRDRCMEEPVPGRPDIRITCLSVGNPHGVIFVPSAERTEVATLGPALEAHAMFPERANIGFAEVIDSSRIRLRVWERGSGETAACGSGACAAVVAGVLTQGLTRTAAVDMPGGELHVSWTDDDRLILTGPAQISFEGTYPGWRSSL